MVEDRHPSHTHFHWTCSKFSFPIPNLLLVQYMSKLASQEDPRLINRTLQTPPIDHFPSVDFSSFPCYEIPASARFFLLQLVFSWKKIISKGNWLDTMLHYLFWKRVSSRNLTIHTSFRSSHYYSIILKPNMGHSICQIPSSKKQGLKYSKGGKLSKLCLSQKVRVNKKQDLQ